MNRRDFLRLAGAATACTGTVTLTDLHEAYGEPHDRLPNVILILADDLGWGELGCYGNTFNETPNLDALARDGARFSHAYSAAPVCSPTRASILTGQWPARIGMTDYLRPNDRNCLSTDHVTLAQMFKGSGYATGIIGKWHLSGYASAGAKEVPPPQYGFDEVIVSENRGIAGGSYFYPYHFNPEIEQRINPKEYLVDRMNLEAVEFIQRHADQPFFLYLSHYAVHTTLVGKPDLVAKYEAKPGSGKWNGAPRNNPHLAAMLESMDEGLGMIRRKLSELSLDDDTIIVFVSDNGGEDKVTVNGGLRKGKSTLYEGGIRVPLIAYVPGTGSAGTVCDTPVCTVDLYPTLLQAARIDPDPRQKMDGVSLVPLLKDSQAELERDTLYWHYPLARPHTLGGRSSGAILQSDWKLIDYYGDDHLELYNLRADPKERRNMASERPGKAAKLRERLHEWRKSVGAD